MRKTSLEAYRSLSHETKSNLYKIILKGCKRLKNGGTFEEIAKAANIEPVNVWKRLNEMITLKMLVNTGETRPTSSGRKAMVRKVNPDFKGQ